MSLKSRFVLPFLVVAASAGAVLAQPQMVDDLDADRERSGEIEIEFEFDGSACLEVGTAEPGDVVDGTLTVNFPTRETAEACTMQVVEIEVEQHVPADDTVRRVEVVVLSPTGEVYATGSTEVDD